MILKRLLIYKVICHKSFSQPLVKLNLPKINLYKTYQKHYLQREAYVWLKTPAPETGMYSSVLSQ